MTREFLQLAHVYDQYEHGIGGWYCSEKLDGMRAYWDGGWTRDKLTSEVPFANTLKDFRRLVSPYSTGLWSRYGKPIAAPSWWLDSLPPFPLDGELYLGPGQFQTLISTVKKYVPVDDEWKHVQYMVFDIPSDYMFLSPGTINNPQWTLDMEDFRDKAPNATSPWAFHKVLRMIELGKLDLGTGPVHLLEQRRLPIQTEAALETMLSMMDEVVAKGGEGLMLRKPESVWTPKRTYDLLKVKPWRDSEATVLGYVWGKGKLEGLMGSLTVRWNERTFELSGFTDEERTLNRIDCNEVISYEEPLAGATVTGHWSSPYFPRGTRVTFKYRGLTDDDYPKEARFWRQRINEGI